MSPWRFLGHLPVVLIRELITSFGFADLGLAREKNTGITGRLIGHLVGVPTSMIGSYASFNRFL